ncbi:hypothetical protein PIB30_021690 [Stylosanthes scabra]|uniref:Retrotransposon gag domain-containing protein n=1 Tax=Stylosanthes scabra TaxID=79078 RepID=A0ABU6Q8R2_9FABA|nr:hypothetical protein [Stylosanthes scabra]
MRRAEAMAARQQALLEEAERRDQELKDKLQNRQSYVDEGDGAEDSHSRTWKPSVVIGKPLAKENSKHPFSLAILSEELPKKFKYPVDMEPCDRTLYRPGASKASLSCPKKPDESLRNYLDRFNAECTQIEGLQCQATLMALVKGLREDTPFLKSLTKRLPKTMEEIQNRSHEYLQQEEGQTTLKTDHDKRETSGKEAPREDREEFQVERIPALRAIKDIHRGDRNAYCKYHKQNGHDTEDCRDLLEFVEQRLKKGKFREYTERNSERGDDRRTRQRVNSPDKSTERKDEPKEGVTRRTIKMISGGLPDEGNPPSRKAAKRSRQSCLAVEIMPRALHDKSPQKSHSPRRKSEEPSTH